MPTVEVTASELDMTLTLIALNHLSLDLILTPVTPASLDTSQINTTLLQRTTALIALVHYSLLVLLIHTPKVGVLWL